jgi:hypothetical protein
MRTCPRYNIYFCSVDMKQLRGRAVYCLLSQSDGKAKVELLCVQTHPFAHGCPTMLITFNEDVIFRTYTRVFECRDVIESPIA